MMVEGGRIDHASHAQDVVGTIYDTLAFDEAIKSAYEFYQKHPQETLIVVAADHETGGMGLGFGNNYFMNLEELKGVKVSIEDTLQKAYNGNRDEYFKYIAKNMGLNNLTEKDIYEKGDTLDFPQSVVEFFEGRLGTPYQGFPEELQKIILKGARPITVRPGAVAAVGADSDKFIGFKDNTDVAKLIAESIGKKIK